MTLTEKSDLDWAMRMALLEKSQILNESTDISYWIKKEITYEQMLNLLFNPEQEMKYKSEAVLENDAKEFIKSYILREEELKNSDLKKQGLQIHASNGVNGNLSQAQVEKLRNLRIKQKELETQSQNSQNNPHIIVSSNNQETKPPTSPQPAPSQPPPQQKPQAKSDNAPKAEHQPKSDSPVDAALKRKNDARIARLRQKSNPSITNLAKSTYASTKDYIYDNPKKSALAGAAGAAALYYLYKKLKNKGMSNKQAAEKVADSARTPEEEEKWQDVADNAS